MKAKRKQHSSTFKSKVALEALKGQKTLSELSHEYGLHSTQVSQWKMQLKEGIGEIFTRRRSKEKADRETVEAALFEEIGRLKVELDWLKKTWTESAKVKQQWTDPHHPQLSVRRQCELIGLCRSSLYYQAAQDSPENLRLMRLIDEQYLRTPFYGSRRMAVCLSRMGDTINRKRIQRLMRQMGLEGLAPGPRTSCRHPQHKVYPYLLRGVIAEAPNHIWAVDITYVPMPIGFMYLVAIIKVDPIV